MNNLILKEKQEFMGIKIPVIEGGFGEGQRVILVKTVAEIHEVETKYVNKLINNNIERFGENDLVDCLSSSKELRNFAKENGLIRSNRTQNVFILSQRGYTKLVAMMDNSNDKKWDVMNNLIDDYFNMRKQLSSRQEIKEIKPNFKEKEIETKNNNSFARVLNALNKILKNPSSSEEAKKEANAKLEKFLSGQGSDLKVLGRKTYSATEIGKKLGVSHQKIGRLSEAHNLKTDEFGEWFKDKSRYSKKEVPSFRYYENAIPVFKGLLSSKEVGKQEKLEV